MNTRLSLPAEDGSAPRASWLQRTSRTALLGNLAALEEGSITFEEGPDRHRVVGARPGELAAVAQVMRSGLWAWTRHPHYFGESCVAFGLALLAQSVPGPAWAFVSPVSITFLLLRISGVSLLERQMSSRPGYREYVARTNAFVPWPPRT